MCSWHPIRPIEALGVLHDARWQNAESAQCFGEVLKIGRRVLGEEDPLVMSAMGNLAMALEALGKEAEAGALYREALQLLRKVLGEEQKETLYSTQRFGALLGHQGRLEEAEPYLREALAGNRRTRGNEHYRTHASMSHLAAVLRRRGKFEEAERLGAEALRKGPQTWVDERPQPAAWFLVEHARTLTALERFEQAEAELHEAQALLADTSVPINSDELLRVWTRKLTKACVELYDARQAAEPDAGYDAKAAEWRAKLPDTEPNSASP